MAGERIMKYFSLFSGIGGFELGIQQAYEKKEDNNLGRATETPNSQNRRNKSLSARSNGKRGRAYSDCVGYSEIDKYAIQIYEKHFPKHKNYGDITKIITPNIPDHDFLVGGFPCQSFSIAGKRRGFEDTRGTLFFEIARILKTKRPRLLLLENVKGLLSHDEGNTFATIISTLDELGYDCQWQVLNSKNFGVPQNRERVFIVGHLRETSRPKVFPIESNDKAHFDQIPPQSSYLKSPLRSQGDKAMIEITKNQSQGYRVYNPKGLASTLAGEAGGVGAKTGLYQVAPVLTPNRPDKRQNGRRIKKNGEPSFTLTGQDVHGVYIRALDLYNKKSHSDRTPCLTEPHHNSLRLQIDNQIRRLTPIECERLQGFPDGWTEGVSDTQRYKTLGNAVSVPVIKEIVKEL